MLKRLFTRPSFDRDFEALSGQDQILATKTVHALKSYFHGHEAAHGLRIKKIHSKSGTESYEARINLSLRLVWIETSNQILLCMIGSHDEVRKFIKNL